VNLFCKRHIANLTEYFSDFLRVMPSSQRCRSRLKTLQLGVVTIYEKLGNLYFISAVKHD